MNTYNKIMLYFWLVVAVIIFLSTTYMGFTSSFKIWGYYYIFAGLALLMFFARRYMMRRMEKHMKYLEEKKKSEQ